MEKMFNPESVAVIGASHVKGKVGRAVLDNLLNGYEGTIYPINPNSTEIEGLKCYKTVLDAPGPSTWRSSSYRQSSCPRQCGSAARKALSIW